MLFGDVLESYVSIYLLSGCKNSSPARNQCSSLTWDSFMQMYYNSTRNQYRPVSKSSQRAFYPSRLSPTKILFVLTPYLCLRIQEEFRIFVTRKVFDIPEQTFDFRLSCLTDVRATGHTKGSCVTCENSVQRVVRSSRDMCAGTHWL